MTPFLALYNTQAQAHISEPKYYGRFLRMHLGLLGCAFYPEQKKGTNLFQQLNCPINSNCNQFINPFNEVVKTTAKLWCCFATTLICLKCTSLVAKVHFYKNNVRYKLINILKFQKCLSEFTLINCFWQF